MSFKRARSEEQVQNRIDEIISATSELYDSYGYDGVSFSKISEHTNFSRPNIYKYFKTKEEIFLVILGNDYKSFVSELIDSFKINKIYSLYDITEIWADTLIRHKRLMEIHALLHTILKKNVSDEALFKLRKDMSNTQIPLARIVSQLFPNATEDEISDFIRDQLVFAFGIYPMLNNKDVQTDINELKEQNKTIQKFKTVYMSCLYKIMYCLKNSIDIKNN
ncbi:TetR/AcrR family transcriptional regulator [Clostridium botulinum]|uniref:TetR/AcrR family transcriptional regulator n=1 Tax=Clostridium botulinum TaxID=1491 RepID=A0A6B4ZQG8_CLOBO|nr:TetR/AcrR family transcriptional regulator [Clostridium botulinum]NFD84451.1 TetR/AcrR family transcriptional regulator [Clostridium botulinum]NFE10100.1 TetR/AcrR family transcriptional regulator [Clostridium botulinum]NFE35345.1 TetR/AcrR family transcriptional regulator [Clostridium botulinum]NFE49943.1 TetR/AcrR family transcriptional regulator [Clostridium botulinum]